MKRPPPTRRLRRQLLGAALLLPCGSLRLAQAQPSPAGEARDRPLRVAAATAVVDSGLARRLREALARDAGLATHWLRGPSAQVLSAVEQGGADVAIAHAPELESALDREGLVHDRRLLGRSEFVLVGPVAAKGRARGKDPLGLKGAPDVLEAFRRLAQAGPQGGIAFVSAPQGTAALTREAALWKAAGVVPQGAWYMRAEGGCAQAIQAALAHNAYLLTDRLSWAALGAKSHAVLVHGDPRLEDVYHAMRSFRSPHPAAKLFMNWLTGPTGRRVLAAGGLQTRGH